MGMPARARRLATCVIGAASVAALFVAGIFALHQHLDAEIHTGGDALRIHAGAYACVFAATTVILGTVASAVTRHIDGLKCLATVDHLTGLANRRELEHRLYEEIRRARRYHTPLALLMIDLDCLKLVNDTYGHAIGDQALRRAARALAATLRKGCDLGARWGGDEFAVLAPNTTEGAAWTLATRIFARVRDDDPLGTTVSIGIAMLEPSNAETINADSLLAAADAAMYQAKTAGADRICCSSRFRSPTSSTHANSRAAAPGARLLSAPRTRASKR